MSCVLFRTSSHSSLAISSRLWISHKCLHVTSPATSSEPSSTKTNGKPSIVKALNLTAAQTRKVTKRVKRPEYKPTENLIKKHLVELRDNPLTFKDVEELKPKQQADAKSKHYELEYIQVLDSLLKSFTGPQLRQYLKYANASPSSKGNKLATAQYILESVWGWMPLKQVIQDRVDWTESAEQYFTLDSGYSFLLVGKDGTELLKLSRRYNVQMSFTNPRSLKVMGLKGALKQVAGYIESFKNDVTIEDFSLPTKGNFTVLADRISRISGAHVKPKDDSKISVSFLKSQPQAGDMAKHLILQAIINENSPTRTIYQKNSETSNAPSSRQYSLYPFLPPQPLPWQKSSSSIFRYRRVGEWMKTPQSDKLETLFEMSADSHGMASLENEFESNIKSVLLRQLGENSPAPPIFTVSSGHLLFLSPPNQPTTLTPPLTGEVDSDALLHWLSTSQDRVVFEPSVPAQVLSIPIREEHNFRRIVYRTIKPAHTDKSVDTSNPPDLVTTLTFELPVIEESYEIDGSATNSAVDLERASLVKGVETSMEVFVPDGSADIKISASQSQSLPISSWPEELKSAAISLQSNATTSHTDASFPLMFTHDGAKFFFGNDAYVHRSLKDVSLEGKDERQTIIVETSTDHETGKSTTVCKAICEDYISHSQWDDFLRMCGSLSIPHPKGNAADHTLDAFSPF